jgi:hypothetical protein
MTERHTLIAFLATLAAIVALVVTGAIMASHGRPAEALGIGGAVTGLIGVIGTFKPRTPSGDSPQPVNVVNPPSDPANVQEAP